MNDSKVVSLVHFRDLIGQSDNVLFETIDFILLRLKRIENDGRAVCFSSAPAPFAASAMTRALCVIRASVRSKIVCSLIVGAIDCLRNSNDASDGNCKFHFCVGSLFLIIILFSTSAPL